MGVGISWVQGDWVATCCLAWVLGTVCGFASDLFSTAASRRAATGTGIGTDRREQCALLCTFGVSRSIFIHSPMASLSARPTGTLLLLCWLCIVNFVTSKEYSLNL